MMLLPIKDLLLSFTPDEVMHIPGLGFDGLVGYSHQLQWPRMLSVLLSQLKSMEANSMPMALHQVECLNIREH